MINLDFDKLLEPLYDDERIPFLLRLQEDVSEHGKISNAVTLVIKDKHFNIFWFSDGFVVLYTFEFE